MVIPSRPRNFNNVVEYDEFVTCAAARGDMARRLEKSYGNPWCIILLDPMDWLLGFGYPCLGCELPCVMVKNVILLRSYTYVLTIAVCDFSR